MLPKSLRFTTLLFDRCFKKSQRIRVGNFLFLVTPSRQARFSVVVGKKISKHAVVRNRLRRQLYEIIRHHLASQIKEKNVIFLYNGPEVLHNSTDFERACRKLCTIISSPKNERGSLFV